MGLSPQFFRYDPENFLSMTRIDTIAPTIFDEQIQDQMQNEGTVITFDTRNILEKIDSESVPPEVIDYVKPLLQEVQIYIKMRRYQIT